MNFTVKVMGHLLILTLVVICSMVLAGRFFRTDVTIDGIDVQKIGQQRVAHLVLNEKKELVATTSIYIFGYVARVPGPMIFYAPLLVVLGLLIIYLPGGFMEKARNWLVRIAMAGALTLATMATL